MDHKDADADQKGLLTENGYQDTQAGQDTDRKTAD